MPEKITPITLYGAEFSYFTGKLQGLLRYMELPHTRLPGSPIGKETSNIQVRQIPSLKLADGRWLTDTTPIVEWLDQQYPELEIVPRNPLLAFFSRLLEDYADEWLWRPAMHFRWSYEESAKHLSRVLVEENTRDVPVPAIVKRYMLRNRQRAVFVNGDGVTPDTWDHVESVYHNSLAQLNTIFSTRPYLLGDRPSIADFGFFGPMFRHFSQDPTSARIMRETGPAVNEWNARLWNARASQHTGELLKELPDDWGPILRSIGSAYLPYLNANAQAWNANHSQYNVDIEGAPYRNIRTSQYRVWCLEELRRHYSELAQEPQQEARLLLQRYDCWAPLWSTETKPSGINVDGKAPFSGGHSMTGVNPSIAEKFYCLPVPRVRPKS